MDQIRAAPLDTHLSPNQGGTYSSASIQRGRPQIAAAAAAGTRALLLTGAAQRLAAPRASTSDGTRRGARAQRSRARTVSYGELIGGRALRAEDAGHGAAEELLPPTAWSASARRAVDLAAQRRWHARYIQHLRLPGMLHAASCGRAARPCYRAGARVLAVDDSASRALRARGYCAVAISSAWWRRVNGMPCVLPQQLRVNWEDPPPARQRGRARRTCAPRTTIDNVVLERGNARRCWRARPCRLRSPATAPIRRMHPSHPTARWPTSVRDTALVICSSQDIYAARRSIAQLRRPAAGTGARAVRRRRRHLWPQLLRRCRAGRCAAVATGWRTGAPAVHARGRAWLGYLWPAACGRSTRRGRQRRPAARLRVPRLAAQLEPGGNHRATRWRRCRRVAARRACRVSTRWCAAACTTSPT